MADAESGRTLNMDGNEYVIDELSDDAKGILNRLSIVSGDEQRLSFELEKVSLIKTGYAAALKQVIERDEQGAKKEAEEPEAGDSGDGSEASEGADSAES